MSELVVASAAGLHCPEGNFYIDPWAPVDRAVITHAHADHAQAGSQRYLCASRGEAILRKRIGPDFQIDTLAYGETLSLAGVTISLHPAGHILGSAQVRIEHRGEVWVVSGDYKLAGDATVEPFESIACHTFISESTFGLPIYRWPDAAAVFSEVNAWWQGNALDKRISVVYAYALGKAQRLLFGLDPAIGPIVCHGAVENINAIYRSCGAMLPETVHASNVHGPADWQRALVIAPPSARGSTWLRRFGNFASAFASGWMQVRGIRRRRSVDRGFVLSDHADWDGLNQAIDSTGAKRVLVTHGMIAPMVRWLRERGLESGAIATRFEGEQDESPATDAADLRGEDAVDGPPGEEGQP